MQKRCFRFSIICVAVLIVTTLSAVSQTYPGKAVRIILPVTPGSPVDALARVVAPHLQIRLGQPVVLENRPGAGTTIGAKAVASAEPDGYTLLLASNGHVYDLYPNLGYDPIKGFVAIATVAGWS